MTELEPCDYVWNTDPPKTGKGEKTPLHNLFRYTHVCDEPATHHESVHACHCGEETWGSEDD
jgi:hypothetical protein